MKNNNKKYIKMFCKYKLILYLCIKEIQTNTITTQRVL